MSYSITIGEATVSSYMESDGEYHARWTAVSKDLPDASNYKGDDVTGNSNCRRPAYSAWTDFCRRNSLETLFFDSDTGLMRSHPGCFQLTEFHLNAFKKALEIREKTDKRPAGLDERYGDDFGVTIPEGEENHDYDKVRLHWLIFWTEWALKNCKKPAMANS